MEILAGKSGKRRKSREKREKSGKRTKNAVVSVKWPKKGQKGRFSRSGNVIRSFGILSKISSMSIYPKDIYVVGIIPKNNKG